MIILTGAGGFIGSVMLGYLNKQSITDVMLFDDLLNESNDGFVTEIGEVESWSKVNREKILKQKEEAIEYLKKLKK